MELIPILSMIVLFGTIATFILAVFAYILYKARERRAREGAARRKSAASGETRAGDDNGGQRGGWMQPPVVEIVSDRPAERDDQAAEEAAPRPSSEESDSLTGSPLSDSQTSPSEAPLQDREDRTRTEPSQRAPADEPDAIPPDWIENDVDAPIITFGVLPVPPAFDATPPSAGAGWQPATSSSISGGIFFWEYTGEGFVPVDPADGTIPSPAASRPNRGAPRVDERGDWL